jgi:hypothetical protein
MTKSINVYQGIRRFSAENITAARTSPLASKYLDLEAKVGMKSFQYYPCINYGVLCSSFKSWNVRLETCSSVRQMHTAISRAFIQWHKSKCEVANWTLTVAALSRIAGDMLQSFDTCRRYIHRHTNKQTPWPLVLKQTIPTERPPLVGEFLC